MNDTELFSNLCNCFDAIAASRSKRSKQVELQKFIANYNRSHFYNVLRLFLPHWERERGPFRLREASFTKTLTNVLCLPPTGSDVMLLKNFNKTSGQTGQIKDYADAAYTVVKKKLGQGTGITIKAINETLDALAAGDIRKQEDIIYDLFKKLSHVEIKWIIRIILKDLKLGISKNDVLAGYHPDAPKYFLTNNSLKQLCSELFDLKKSVSEVQVSLFNAFRPMLSLRCNVKELNKFNDEQELCFEQKFDGERFQLHFASRKFKYFSRNGFDYTAEFKDHAERIKGAITAENVILDGEMMIYNKRSKTFGSKGMYADIKKVKVDSNIQQCFCVFDIVYLNNQHLCTKPLNERKRLLAQVVKPIAGLIQISAWSIGHNKQDILNALNKSVDAKEEGIVFKCPQSKYLPNERVGWWKVKLEYFEGVMSDLDVLIIGGYYGVGASKGEITGFLVAAKNDAGEYLSFAKISTGLNRHELKTLNDKLNKHWLDVPKNNEQEEVAKVFWGKEVPNKWIKPEHSACLLVRGSELIKLYSANSDYRTAYTLRFPRIISLRLDKPYYDCLTTKDLQSLTESSSVVEKLNKRHLELSDLEVQVQPKRIKRAGPRDLAFLPVDVQTDVLAPHKFHVLTGIGKWTKQLVETAIRENGGSALIESTKDTLCMLVGDDHIRMRTYHGDIDIVRVDWLRRVLNEGEFFMYEPFDIVYMSETSRRKFMKDFDKFGDSYTKPATKASLNRILNEHFLKNDDFHINLTRAELNEFHTEINFHDDDKLLRGCVAYFDRYKIINDPMSRELCHLDFMQQIEFRLHGGIVSECLNEDCDCIIAARERFDEINNYLKMERLPCNIPIYSSTQEYIQRRTQPSTSTS